MIVLTDGQVMALYRLLTAVLLDEAYQVSELEDALIWLSPENRQILCPFESLWARSLAQEIVRELRSQT